MAGLVAAAAAAMHPGSGSSQPGSHTRPAFGSSTVPEPGEKVREEIFSPASIMGLYLYYLL